MTHSSAPLRRSRTSPLRRSHTFTNSGYVFDLIDQGPLDGPVIVLLHGFPERASSWSAVMAVLNEQGYRTIAPDQRGYSPNARPARRREYRVSALVSDVVALIDTIGTPVHLVGHDWGANLAWVTAAKYPDLIRSLTAFSVPHPGGYLRALLSSKQFFMSWYFAYFQLPYIPERWITRRASSWAWFTRGGMRPVDLDRVREEIIDYGAVSGAVNWYRGLLFSSPAMYGGRVRVPTSMVWSDGDTFIGRAAVNRCERHVDGPYSLTDLPGVTHWIPEQAPEAAAAAIIERAK